MKYLAAFFSGLVLLLSSCSQVPAYPDPATTPPSYVVMEVNSSRVLFSANANQKRPIGMLVNVATASVVLDWVRAAKVDMGTMLTVPETVQRWPGTNLMHLKPGEQISLRDALHSTLMWDDSASAATVARACGIALNATDPDDAFISQLNQLGKRLGMTSTYFKGTNGAVITQSTARDMALLAQYALQDTVLLSICSKRSYTAMIYNGGIARQKTVTNSNSLLRASESVDGIRAARSRSAGGCLLATSRRASVKREDPRTGQMNTYAQRILVVILGMPAQERYKAAARFIRDGWGAWEEWFKTGDFSDKDKFIVLPN